jgi:hypothetical protein
MPLTVFRVTDAFAVRSDRVGPNTLKNQTFTTKGTTPSDKVAWTL